MKGTPLQTTTTSLPGTWAGLFITVPTRIHRAAWHGEATAIAEVPGPYTVHVRRSWALADGESGTVDVTCVAQLLQRSGLP
eukprot:m.106233 g.106233  ORF g.106233 m.106233 type:complete len:81 (-) comp12689_c0_seq2:296-538(-)